MPKTTSVKASKKSSTYDDSGPIVNSKSSTSLKRSGASVDTESKSKPSVRDAHELLDSDIELVTPSKPTGIKRKKAKPKIKRKVVADNAGPAFEKWTNLKLTGNRANIKDQPALVRRVVNIGIKLFGGKAVFDVAYPEIGDKQIFLRNTLVEACTVEETYPRLRGTGLTGSMPNSSSFMHVLPPFHRPREPQKFIQPRLPTVYKFKLPIGRRRHTADVKGMLEDLCLDFEYLFAMGNGSDLSSVEFSRINPRQPPQVEILKTMLAAAAAMIRVVLNFWSNGIEMPVELQNETRTSLYNEHLSYIDNLIKDAGRMRGHRMLANTLSAAQNYNDAALIVTQQAATAFADFSNMAE
ncbi:hypothetical protein EIP91_010845 [Steccherinum ochraceum]|uniref:Uncharacterized protein n=1 Tax=Steccherinum ochraceum TaxID=92696 RepID=A0A4R0R070_9APHY|nr:hypothetical protein EIP91_010845 [Steccherinum ochraceum]